MNRDRSTRQGAWRLAFTAHTATLKRSAMIAAAFTATTVVLSGCSSSPPTQAELCANYDALAKQVMQGNGFGNPVFDAIDELAGSASAYTGADLEGDADRLNEISDSESTSIGELEEASQDIANHCDAAPLSIQALTSGSSG